MTLSRNGINKICLNTGVINRQTIDLGFILRHFPYVEFSMDGFDGRLRLQRFICLLQTFDIYLGYEFSWYIR